jgi:hypothetical protein
MYADRKNFVKGVYKIIRRKYLHLSAVICLQLINQQIQSNLFGTYFKNLLSCCPFFASAVLFATFFNTGAEVKSRIAAP